MKKYVYIISAVIVLLLLGTVNGPHSLSYDPTLVFEENSTASGTSPLLPLDEKTIAEQGPIPAPVGDKWYDWDNVGTYQNYIEGMALAGDASYIYAADNGRLSRCAPDGSNAITLVHEDYDYIDCINCKGGYVYFSDCMGLNKIKNDGTGKIRLLDDAVRFLVHNDRIYYFTYKDEHLHMLNETSGETQDLGFADSNIMCLDQNYLFLDKRSSSDPDTYVLYVFDTQTQKSRRLFTLPETEYGMVAADGMLYFFDRVGGSICLVSYDISNGKKDVLVKIFNEELQGKNAENLLRYDRYLIYFTTQETANDMLTTMWGYDMITGKLYEFGKTSYGSSGFVVATPKYLYIENYRIYFEDGGIKSERLKSNVLEFE